MTAGWSYRARRQGRMDATGRARGQNTPCLVHHPHQQLKKRDKILEKNVCIPEFASKERCELVPRPAKDLVQGSQPQGACFLNYLSSTQCPAKRARVAPPPPPALASPPAPFKRARSSTTNIKHTAFFTPRTIIAKSRRIPRRQYVPRWQEATTGHTRTHLIAPNSSIPYLLLRFVGNHPRNTLQTKSCLPRTAVDAQRAHQWCCSWPALCSSSSSTLVCILTHARL